MTISKTSNLWFTWSIVIFVLLLPPLFLNCAAQGGQEATTSNAKAKFDTDFFPINPWCSYFRSGLSGMADCNFTTAGFFVESKDLPYCKKLGLKAILPSGLPRDFVRLSELSDEEIDRRIKEAVSETKNNPNVLGYFLIDEPGATAYHALGVAVQAVEKYAPGKLA